MARPNPTNFHEYEYGTSNSPRSSISGRSVRFESGNFSPSEASDLLDIPDGQNGPENGIRRRRSSIAMRLSSITHVGGVNSIENFARSLTRATGFHEINPRQPAFILADDSPEEGPEDDLEYGSVRSESGHFPRAGLSKQNLDNESPENAVDDQSVVGTPPRFIHRKSSDIDHRISDVGSLPGSMRGGQSIFAIAPHLGTPLAGSYGASYGTLRSNLNESSMAHAGQLWKQQQAAGANVLDGEHMPLIVKEVEQDGKIVYVVEGQSTLYQTVLNSTNTLIGIGLLSLPMGLKYSGWLCGMIFLLLSAVVTSYTARLLAKCMDRDNSLLSFSDLAYVSFGNKARLATSVLFTLELLAACVALIVLFGDTLHLLIPSVGVVEWKVLCGILLIPLSFAPLRYLSYTSILGILSCFSIIIIIIIDGFTKPHAPGSLVEPAKQYLFPANWLTLPLSFGLLMSPWGGHSVFPNIYKDMRHPYKFPKAVKYTFSFTYLLDAATAVIGILMFGDDVRDEITANILESSSYPRSLSLMICIFIVIIPLSKLPLNSRPIIALIESSCGLDARGMSDSPALTGLSGYTRGFLKIAIRISVLVLFVVIAIIFPSFDSIMSLMGSALCFTICVILPLMFYLKMFGKEISPRERSLDYFLIVVSSIMALVGTVWAFLPKELIGAE
ncbi:transmembrane amino acid transporter protein [Rutstroemia sp. NJR-2017a WRK4]|nr:transmembrane amino acid transporter protein [Rutstroemia sp. NJR-2017a WRK4]